MSPLYRFYFTKFLTGLRFFVPIWIIWGSNFLTVSQQTTLEVVVVMLGIMGELPTGAFADIVGRKKSLALGWLIVGISFFGIGFASNAFWYSFWWIFSAAGGAFVSGSESAWLYDYLAENNQEKKFAQISSIGALWFRAGIIIATFAGGYLFSLSSWLPYLLMGISYLVAAIYWLTLPEPKIDTVKFTFSNYLFQMKQGVTEAFKTKETANLTWFYIIAGGIIQVCFFFFNYSYALDLGFGGDKQSLLFGISGVIKALSVFVLAKYLFEIGKTKIYWGFVLVPALFLLLSNWAPMWLAILIIFVIEGIGAARGSVLDHYANEVFDAKVRATALSFLNMGVSLIYALILLLGGFVVKTQNTAYLYSILGIILLLVGIPLAHQLTKKMKVSV